MNKPPYNPIHSNTFWRAVAAFCCLIFAPSFVCSAAVVVYVNEQGSLFGLNRPEIGDAISALEALATPPGESNTGQKLSSGVLPGTKVLALQTDGDTTTLEFSLEIIGSGLDEARLAVIFEQVKATLWQFGLKGSMRLQAGGKLLSDYLPPVMPVEPSTSAKGTSPNLVGLSGRKIALSPGHGWFWNGSGWYTQRPVYCSPLNQEDFHNLEEMQYLNTYLTQDGATTYPYRCLNKSQGTDPTSGKAWWQVAAYVWLKSQGYPCSVYASYSGDCTLGSGSSESSDDIRARPLAADYDGTDIYVSLHSNGYTGDCTGSCPTGTETYWDSTGGAPAASQALANAINPAIMAAITGNADASWTCHGTCVKNSNGAYGEIRIPSRAATLTELAFHDTCDRDADANHLRDNFFRSTAMWGMYKGICDYFGVTPGWAYYSDEYVSDTIPTTMTAGQSYNVSVTFRNRGVVWSDARAFHLGANGDSDPFTATTRHTISGEVGPGNTYTFNFTLTAPTTAGTYTTDWRMVRDGYAWFGATLSKQVIVNASGAPTITTQPVGQTIMVGDPVSFSVAATGDAPLSYQWRRNGADLSNGGNVWGVTATTLTITNVQQSNAGTYTVLVSNPNGSVLSAEAVLTVQLGYPAAWGPFSASVERDIHGGTGYDQGFSTLLRLAQYSTAPTDSKSRCLWDFDTTTAPESSLAAAGDNCTFTFYHTSTATYSCGTTATKYQAYARLYALAQDWTSAAIWTKRDAVNNWTTAGGTLGNQLGAEQLLYGNCNTAFTLTFAQSLFPSGSPAYGVILMSPQEGDSANPATHRKGISSKAEQSGNPEQWATLKINYLAPPGTANAVVRSWAYLGWYDQGSTTDRQLRIDTDQLAGTYGGVPVTEVDVASKAGGTSYGNAYGVRQWAQATYTNDLVSLNSSHFYNAVHENAVTYCFVYVYSSKGSSITDAYLGIGSDDGCKVWWNGAVVGSDVVGRGVSADSDFWGPITINNGWNRLMIKVENGTTGHGVYARFANANRTALTDKSYLSFYTTDATAPTAPAGLAVAGVTSGVWQNTVAAPTFTWTSGADSQGSGEGVSGVRGQKFYFGTSSSTSPDTYQTGTSYAPGAQADGEYYFKVTTVDGALNESTAASFTFMYDGAAPTPITGFGSTSPGTSDTDWYNSTGDLTWTWTAATDAASGLDGYAIVQDQTVGTVPGATKTHEGSTTGYTLSGPQPSGEYWLHVRAKDMVGNWQAPASISHRPIRIDRAAPTDVSIGFGTVTTDSITVTGLGTDIHSGINPVTGYNYGRAGAGDSGAKGANHTWTGLEANTEYTGLTVTISDQAVPVSNTAASTPVSQWTLSVAPAADSITADAVSPSIGSNVTWTAVNGFGPGKVQYYRYAWDTSSSHTWADTETQWSSGTVTTVPSSAGTWYLHVKGYNGADAGNGAFDYALATAEVLSQTNAIAAMASNPDGSFTLSFIGTPQAKYYVVTSPDPTTLMSGWQVLPNSTNTASAPDGVWSVTVTNDAAQRFYRSAAVNP